MGTISKLTFGRRGSEENQISAYEDPETRIGAPSLDQHGAELRREFASGKEESKI